MQTLEQIREEIERNTLPVSCRATDYPPGWQIASHAHTKHQLVYAVHGVMMVNADAGQWVVPPTRGIWMPAGTNHAIRCIGVVHMRSLFVRPDVATHLSRQSQAVGISPMLRELIQAAVAVTTPYGENSREGRLMGLILDELRALPVLPLHLPQPSDPRLRLICEQLQRQPDDSSTLESWAASLKVNVKTIQRLFAKEAGMTFGQWRQQARLLGALERLATGEKIVDIALALGYDSPSAFATMFKRQFGQTPSQFFR
jgi:AraC-like DNA-binding protein